MAESTSRIAKKGYSPRPTTRQSLTVLLASTALGAAPAHATDGTWLGGNGAGPTEWVEPLNWNPNTVPDGTASFTSTANSTTVDANGLVNIGVINFTSTALTYTITNNDIFLVNGTGVTNNNVGATQSFTVNSTMVFQNASSASNGPGPVTYSNASIISFSDGSNAGSATINNAGDVEFNNSSMAGSATISNNAAINFQDASSASAAQITNNGTGVIAFNSMSSAGTAIIGNSGALQFINSSTASNANVTNNSGATLVFFNASMAGGATILNNFGAGISFNDNSTAASAVINNHGAVTFGDSSTGGSSGITNNTGATVSFSDNSNAGTAALTNAGTVNFNGSATALNANFINNLGATINFNGGSFGGFAIFTNAGIVNFNSAATALNATVTNNNGAFLNFHNLSQSGSAFIINQAGGTTQFLDSSNAGSAAINNNGGSTRFNDSSHAGSAVITTDNNGSVLFVGTSNGDIASFVTNAGGVFDISGLSSAGTTAGSIAGAGNYSLGSKTLTVGGNNLSTAVSGTISDSGGGALTKVGMGMLTLSGSNTYTGATTVNGGALVVDGSTALSSLTMVNSGGTLAGSGTVGTTAIAGGALAPGSVGGSAFGPLTVQGNLSFAAASTYLIQVSPTNAGRTNVNGTAALGGATVNAAFQPGSYVDRQYTIINATGGVSGSFNPTVTSNMTNLQSTLTYDANDVFLNIKLFFAPPPGLTLSVNQQNVGNALTSFFNATGSIPATFAGLNASGLTIAAGELGTGVIQSSIKADDLFLNLLLDPSIAGRAGGFTGAGSGVPGFAGNDQTSAYAAKPRATPGERDAYAMVSKAPLFAAQPVSRWSVWGAAYGGSEAIGGHAAVGSQDTRASVYGLVAGADYRISPATLLGFAVAGGNAGFALSNRFGSGSADLFQAGLFARHNFGPAYLSAALGYGWHDVTTDRTVALAGVEQLQGRFRADSFSGRFEGGDRFALRWVGLTPYAAAQVIGFHRPAYAEQTLAGGGLFALNYAAQTTTDTRTELGLRGDRSFAMPDAALTLRGRAAWGHDFNPSRSATAIFQALPAAAFTVNGARPDPDSALVSAGAETKWLNGFSLAATFEGEFSGNVTSYSGKAVARYIW